LSTYDIVELRGEEEMRSAYALMHELRLDVSQVVYMQRLSDMVTNGYRLFALQVDGHHVALAGVTLATNLYYGRYLWVYDLVTTERQRSRGHGRKLLDYLEQMARNEHCDTIALSSGVQRLDAHRFYEDRMGYERASFVFKKDLRRH
jgi:GNAT superfamily N-acetyltransferase